MSSNKDTPKLVELGANTRGAASKKNLDVSGTLGPDYLGQETVDVDGHSKDRPGVRYRGPENRGTITDTDGREHVHPKVAKMDTGEELPVLLSSSMSTDPIEGTQGSYKQIIEGECARCGYDRLVEGVHTMSGERTRTCNACGARQNPRSDQGYTMPKTEKDRAKETKEAGEVIGSLRHSGDIVDLEDHTGWGPMVSLVDSRSKYSLWKDEVETLFWTLVDNDDIDLGETLDDNVNDVDRVGVLLEWIPDSLDLVPADEDGEDEE